MIKDFVKQITAQLETTGADVYFKDTSKDNDYILFNVEIYDKSYARSTGQIKVDVRYADVMSLLDMQDAVILALDNWHYANDTTAAQMDFVILNDLSSVPNKQHFSELRFEFILRWEE